MLGSSSCSESHVKKMLLGLLAAVAAAVVVILGLASTAPDVIHVQRSTVTTATAADVLPLVSDLHHFTEWSPWEAKDPTKVSTFSDPAAGVGAWYAWKGNKQVGEGRMTVLTVTPTEVTEDLSFTAPWQSQAKVTVRTEPQGEGLKLSWAYDQPADFSAKVMSVFMNMDTMMGPDFEQGLARLKILAEAAATARVEAELAAAAVSEPAAAANE